MHIPFSRRTALKLAMSACLPGSIAGIACTQPIPAVGGKPANPIRPGSGVEQQKNAPIPNARSYPTEIGGRTLEEWIRDIDSSDPSVRAHAIQIIVEFGPSARKAIPAITRQVKRLNDLSPQAYAIIALAELVPMAPPSANPDKWTTDAINALILELENPESVIRFPRRRRSATSDRRLAMR